MTTSREHLEKFSREDLIGTIQALEDSLAEAAKGLMTEGSAQELAALKSSHQDMEQFYRQQLNGMARDVGRFAGYLERIPRLIRWWYGV